MAISKKQMKGKLRILLNGKKDIVQPGRLLAHLANELNLTGKNSNGGQVRECIAECLDELEADGLVILMKSGKVYDEVHRTLRQRAIRSDVKVKQKKVDKPKPAAHQEPAVTFNQEAGEEPSMNTTVEEKTQQQSEADAALEIVTTLTEKAEEFKAKYESEVAEHTKTKECKATIQEAKSNLEAELAKRDRTIAKMEEEYSLLQAENTQLETAVTNGTKLLEGAEASLIEANARIVEVEREKAEMTANRSTQMSDLAARIRALNEPTTTS